MSSHQPCTHTPGLQLALLGVITIVLMALVLPVAQPPTKTGVRMVSALSMLHTQWPSLAMYVQIVHSFCHLWSCMSCTNTCCGRNIGARFPDLAVAGSKTRYTHSSLKLSHVVLQQERTQFSTQLTTYLIAGIVGNARRTMKQISNAMPTVRPYN